MDHNSDTSGLITTKEDHTLLEALAITTCDMPITPIEVRDALSPEDIEDWQDNNFTNDNLTAFALSLIQRQEMNQGKVPTDFTEHAICKQCGPVFLWFAGEVQGCPWCWNRARGRDIPQPGPD